MSTDDTPSDSSLQLEIGKKLFDIVIAATTDEHGVHAETAIASTAHMAGMFLLLSFNLNLTNMEPGQVVLSEEANERGPELLGVLSSALRAMNVTIDTDNLGKGVPEEHKPHFSVLESEERLFAPFMEVSQSAAASNETMARAAAVTVGVLIADSQAALDPTIGFSLAAYGFVEGAKTVPIQM